MIRERQQTTVQAPSPTCFTTAVISNSVRVDQTNAPHNSWVTSAGRRGCPPRTLFPRNIANPNLPAVSSCEMHWSHAHSQSHTPIPHRRTRDLAQTSWTTSLARKMQRNSPLHVRNPHPVQFTCVFCRISPQWLQWLPQAHPPWLGGPPRTSLVGCWPLQHRHAPCMNNHPFCNVRVLSRRSSPSRSCVGQRPGCWGAGGRKGGGPPSL